MVTDPIVPTYSIETFIHDVQIELDNQSNDEYHRGFDEGRNSDDVHIGEVIGQLRINLPLSEQDPAEHAANLRSPQAPEGYQWWHYVVANTCVSLGITTIDPSTITPIKIAGITGILGVYNAPFAPTQDAQQINELISMMADNIT